MSESKKPCKPTVLCVDDEQNVLDSLQRTLRKEGYQLFFCTEATQALKLFEETDIDLLITDMRMPEIDGATLLAEVESKWPNTVKILLTGYADIDPIISAVNVGKIFEYISKPWDSAELKKSIKQAIEIKYLNQEKHLLEDLTQTHNRKLKIINTELDKKAKYLNKAQNRLSHLLNLSKNEIYIFVLGSYLIIDANQAALNNLGYNQYEISKTNLFEIAPSLDARKIEKHRETLNNNEIDSITIESEFRRKDDSSYPVEINLHVANTENISVYYAIVQDLTERNITLDKLHRASYYSNTTGLPNRELFFKQLDKAINITDTNSSRMALMLINIDHFWKVNESVGYRNGDLILKEISNRFKAVIQNNAEIGLTTTANEIVNLSHIGGDEFSVIVCNVHQDEDTSLLAERLLNCMREPLQVNGVQMFMSICVGIHLYTNDGSDVDTLIRGAENALAKAKSLGPNHFQYHTDSTHQQSDQKSNIKS